MARRQRDAGDRQHEADDLRPGHAQPEQQEIDEEDQHRNAGLLDADIDRRGVDRARV